LIHNLFSFHGVDHKVGTTMIAQSVAQIISSYYPNLKVLLISMNGRDSTEYLREIPIGIDAVKFHIDNKMISGNEFLRTCTHKGNFYMMSGVSNELEQRYYYPEMAKYLLEEIAPEFDIIIADCGNELDNGLAVGTLTVSEEIYMIITQQESMIRRYEKNKCYLDDLGFGITAFIVNKYYEQDPYGLSYLSSRMQIEKERLWKMDSAGYSRQAEIDNKTLLEYKNEIYLDDILTIANYILNKKGLNEIKQKRKSRWKSFI